jgi:catechol 2,3-dioxygenase-like lactoylglutathione lyase family enzyme
MRLNQVTVYMPDLEAGWRFYTSLGLRPIVDARPRYARFELPDGGGTFSLNQGGARPGGVTIYFECDSLDPLVERLEQQGLVFTTRPQDQPWLWREASLHDPAGNLIILYFAGENRLNPPWRLTEPRLEGPP